MNPERIINLTRKNENGDTEQIDVKMLYCAATETGYQDESDKTMDVFVPSFSVNDEGKPYITEPPKAKDKDYIQLAIAAINAAYECDGGKSPVKSDDIMYHSTRAQVVAMCKAVIEMHQEWLMLPSTIEKETDENKSRGKNVKNAETPTTHTRQS